MMNDSRARMGRNSSPLIEYDFTNEYLSRIRGCDFIPVRKNKDYQIIGNGNQRSNYETPLMKSLNKSRKSGKRN